MREVLASRLLLQKCRPKCGAEGLERRVYIAGRFTKLLAKMEGRIIIGCWPTFQCDRRVPRGRMADIGSLGSRVDSVSRSGTRVLEGAPEL